MPLSKSIELSPRERERRRLTRILFFHFVKVYKQRGNVYFLSTKEEVLRDTEKKLTEMNS